MNGVILLCIFQILLMTMHIFTRILDGKTNGKIGINERSKQKSSNKTFWWFEKKNEKK